MLSRQERIDILNSFVDKFYAVGQRLKNNYKEFPALVEKYKAYDQVPLKELYNYNLFDKTEYDDMTDLIFYKNRWAFLKPFHADN